ncbi:hypothetical protein NLG97_g6840 [Lecanicillium saksenae]|uniref:Uncharacterized protein n=1 Tax=Lecanicillium saksenae TaxID=468837 RepID=A0ACC1QRP6_9HYPO|nr:hypothetical protein NLG97_g6840 [Lecanicillium saksenae]
MFELPEAKRVRREDLGDSSDESGVDGADGIANDEAMQARVNAQIAAALGLDDAEEDGAFNDEPSVPSEKLERKTHQTNLTDDEDHDENADEDDAEQGYEFNLFSTAGPGGARGPAKVILEDDAEMAGDGGFVRPRPLSYYAAKAPSSKQKEQYSYAAVTADDVVRWSTQRSWGMEMPWKVISVSATRKAKPGDKSIEILVENTDEAAKRKRPGKKQRILLRQRKKGKAQAAEDAAKKQTEKEEHLKDKKKRLNRIKKLRKRAKDKEKKLAAGEEPDADAASDSNDDE